MDEQDKVDVTSWAVQPDVKLPQGWKVLAWKEDEEQPTDPRNEGDCYRTDNGDGDPNNRTEGFCLNCGQWIKKLDAEDVAYTLAEEETAEVDRDDDRYLEPVVGAWMAGETGLWCTRNRDYHELDVPLIVRAWLDGKWQFVTVVIEVVDGNGVILASDALGSLESGSLPTVSGADVEWRDADPLTDRAYPLPDMVSQALAEALQYFRENFSEPSSVGAPSSTPLTVGYATALARLITAVRSNSVVARSVDGALIL